jgi:hypothetical protein
MKSRLKNKHENFALDVAVGEGNPIMGRIIIDAGLSVLGGLQAVSTLPALRIAGIVAITALAFASPFLILWALRYAAT